MRTKMDLQSSYLDLSYSPYKKSLRYIAVWEKSSRLCKAYHPGVPPCFFPSQFLPQSLLSNPQSLQSLPLFVQQCPSSQVYLQFCNEDNSKKNQPASKTVLNRNILLDAPMPTSLGGRSGVCSEARPPSPLSSIYSSIRLVYNARAASQSHRHTPNRSTSRLSSKYTEIDGTRNEDLPRLSFSNRTRKNQEFLALNVNQQKWENADYCHVKRITDECRALILLVSEELLNLEYPGIP